MQEFKVEQTMPTVAKKYLNQKRALVSRSGREKDLLKSKA
jgi:hypothetical protein